MRKKGTEVDVGRYIKPGQMPPQITPECSELFDAHWEWAATAGIDKPLDVQGFHYFLQNLLGWEADKASWAVRAAMRADREAILPKRLEAMKPKGTEGK